MSAKTTTTTTVELTCDLCEQKVERAAFTLNLQRTAHADADKGRVDICQRCQTKPVSALFAVVQQRVDAMERWEGQF